jgi:chromosome segregation ATPase
LAAVPSAPTGERSGRRTTEESRRPTRAGTGAEHSGSASRRSTVERESRADKEREQRDAAVHRVDEAREALGTATAELAVQDGSAQDATRRLEDLQSRFDELRTQIQQVEQQLGVAERVAKVEARRLDAARKAHQKAEADLKRAEENARK